MKLPSSSAPPGGPVRCPEVVKRLDYEGELAVVMGADGADRRLRGRRRRLARATCRGASRSGRAPRASTRSARGARGSRPPTRSPTREPAPDARTSTASCARTASTVRPHLRPAGDRRLHRRDVHARARRPDPHRHAERRRPSMDPPRLPDAGDVVRIEIEGLGVIEHPIALIATAHRAARARWPGANASQSLLK